MIPGSANPLLLAGAEDAGYAIERSVRFNSSDSAYLSKNFGSAGNRKTWTWSGWVKRSALGSSQIIFSGVQDGNNGSVLSFTSADQINFFNYVGGAYSGRRITTSVYRDTSAWYHIVFVWDSANATVSSRIRIYVNGIEVTEFSTSTDPSSADSIVNSINAHYIGADVGFNNFYSNQYLADIHFIDGQALDHTSFTEVDATTGQLVPIEYTGTFGTNGFHLPFSDNSTAAALGTDTSGAGNNWTVNNISVAAGSGNDSLVDTPTNDGTDTGAGGEVKGNYATLNPLNKSTGTLSNGNLDYSISALGACRGSLMVSSGKWYFEVTLTSSGNPYVGIAGVGQTSSSGIGYVSPNAIAANNVGDIYYSYGGSLTYPGKTVSIGTGTIGIAIDVDNKKIWWSKNGTWYKFDASTANLTTTIAEVEAGNFSTSFSNLEGDFFTVHLGNSTTNNTIYSLNTGQRPFAYTAPSGYKALCTQNLDDPLVAKPSTAMDVALYTGNGSTQTISGLGFSPDLVWIKARNTTWWHALYDIVRGTNQRLVTNTTDAEGTTSNSVTSFNSDGFTTGSYIGTNNLNDTFVAWTWDAGSSTVSNTDGSITTSVRSNASAGFSVATWTGSGANATIGHGCGAAPKFFVIKRRDTSASWIAWHSGIGSTDILRLESTNAKQTIAGFWQGTNPTSTLAYLDADGTVNANGGTYVGYFWAPVDGYSSFGSYTGNGSADGPFVFTGMRPRWILFKCSSAVGYWGIYDAARNTYNAVNLGLYPNDSIAELVDQPFDFLSNGFKVRGTSTFVNTNGSTYIYAAFAESPQKFSRAR